MPSETNDPKKREGENKKKEQEISAKVEEANERMEMKRGEEQAEIQEKNLKFLGKFHDLWKLLDEYEKRIGKDFADQEEEIVTILREYTEGKKGVDLDDDVERSHMEDTLKKKLGAEISKRFNIAA